MKGENNTSAAVPQTTAPVQLNAIVVLQMNREVADGDDAVVEHEGFDMLLTKYTNGHKRWTVIQPKDQNPRINKTLDPCVQALRDRGCEVSVAEIAEKITSSSPMQPIAHHVHRAALGSHVLVCTPIGAREQLVAAVLRQIYKLQDHVDLTPGAASGVADVLTPQTTAAYKKGSTNKRGTPKSDSNPRVVVKLIGR